VAVTPPSIAPKFWDNNADFMAPIADIWRNATDSDLLAAFASGDMGAAQALSERLVPRVLAQATRMLGDQSMAEDVAQDAMMRLWKMAPDWRADQAQVSTWLYRVVANLCTDRLRKRRAVPLDQIAEPADPQQSVAQDLQDRARMAALSDALAQLPARQAQAVALRHLEGLDNPQIAQIMGLNLRAVESLTARGKKSLVRILHGRKAALGYEDDKT